MSRQSLEPSGEGAKRASARAERQTRGRRVSIHRREVRPAAECQPEESEAPAPERHGRVRGFMTDGVGLCVSGPARRAGNEERTFVLLRRSRRRTAAALLHVRRRTAEMLCTGVRQGRREELEFYMIMGTHRPAARLLVSVGQTPRSPRRVPERRRRERRKEKTILEEKTNSSVLGARAGGVGGSHAVGRAAARGMAMGAADGSAVGAAARTHHRGIEGVVVCPSSSAAASCDRYRIR